MIFDSLIKSACIRRFTPNIVRRNTDLWACPTQTCFASRHLLIRYDSRWQQSIRSKSC